MSARGAVHDRRKYLWHKLKPNKKQKGLEQLTKKNSF